MKKTMKILLLAVIGVMFIVLSLPTIVNAGMVLDANTNFAGTGDIQGAASKIAGVVAVIASGVAITMLIWLAAKYMTAAPSEKADIKKSATTYVIGAVILFAASALAGAVYNMVNSF